MNVNYLVKTIKIFKTLYLFNNEILKLNELNNNTS